jgi:hypothetical protein
MAGAQGARGGGKKEGWLGQALKVLWVRGHMRGLILRALGSPRVLIKGQYGLMYVFNITQGLV